MLHLINLVLLGTISKGLSKCILHWPLGFTILFKAMCAYSLVQGMPVNVFLMVTVISSWCFMLNLIFIRDLRHCCGYIAGLGLVWFG